MVMESGADAETLKKHTAKARQDGSDPDEGATIEASSLKTLRMPWMKTKRWPNDPKLWGLSRYDRFAPTLHLCTQLEVTAALGNNRCPH